MRLKFFIFLCFFSAVFIPALRGGEAGAKANFLFPKEKRNGNIVIEAEDYSGSIRAGRSGDEWERVRDANASGGWAMASGGPDARYATFQDASKASRLDYSVRFQERGAYFVFVRARSPGEDSEILHVGLNGKPVLSGDRVGSFHRKARSGKYVWLNQRRLRDEDKGGFIHPRALIQVPSPGRHAVNIWTGDSGLVLDTIVLAPDALTTVDDSGIQDVVFDPGMGDSFDLVVYGGTVAGWAAAIQAAREGRSVVLLERTRHIGNISINGVNGTEGHTPLGNASGNTFGGVTIGGLNEELYRRIGDINNNGKLAHRWQPYVGERVLSRMLADAGAKVRFEQKILQVNKNGPTIVSIQMNDGAVISGKVFIDASYEGDLMARAGVSYTYGREGYHAYQEPLAGIQWQKNSKRVDHPGGLRDENGDFLFPIDGYKQDFVQGAPDFRPNAMNFQTFLTTAEANKKEWTPPEDYDPARYEAWRRWLNTAAENVKLSDFVYAGDRGNRKYPFNDLTSSREAKLGLSTGSRKLYWRYPDAPYAIQEKIDRAEKNFFLGLIYFIGHDPDTDIHPKARALLSDFALPLDEYVDNGNIAYWFYVRSARRLLGQYVLTQHDVDADNAKPDSIATMEHKIDIHIPHTTALKTGDGEARFHNEGYVFQKPANGPWEFPYRALLPREPECDNLLVSVAVSASNIAHSSCRVQTAITALGQASGVAAAMAVESNQGVNEIDVQELRRRLKALGVIVDRPEGPYHRP